MGGKLKGLAAAHDEFHEPLAIAAFNKHFGLAPRATAPKDPGAGGKPLAVDPAHVAMLLDRKDAVGKWKPAYHVNLSADILVNAAKLVRELEPSKELEILIYDRDFPVTVTSRGGRFAVLLAPRINSDASAVPLRSHEAEKEVAKLREEVARLEALNTAYSSRISGLSRLEHRAEGYAKDKSVANLTRLLEAVEKLNAPAAPIGGDATAVAAEAV